MKTREVEFGSSNPVAVEQLQAFVQPTPPLPAEALSVLSPPVWRRAIASKAYVARRHLAMPASTDYWINDRSGDPLLVITGELDAALTKALPRLLREVRDVAGERRVTIVFDRDGWSPKLFSTMITDGFDLLTYRKGRCRRINERRFIRRRAELDGRWVHYLLHDQPVRFLKGKLRLRQVTRLCDGGHQTQVITSRRDLRVPRPISSTTACERFHKTVDWRRCVRTNGPRPTRPNGETG